MKNNIIYKKALDNAIASVEIEGYEISENQRNFCLEFVSGNINQDDFIKQMLERCRA